MELNAKELVAALKFVMSSAGKNDVRYYLNGVAFEVKNERLTLVGCDGHRGAHVELKGAIKMPDMTYIAERQSIDTLIKVIGKRETVRLDYGDDGVLYALIDLDRIALVMIDGKYPKWREAFFRGETEATEQYAINAKYMAEAAKSCQILLGSRCFPAIVTKLRGPNSIIEFVPDIDQEAMTSIHSASMVVMPLRQ